MSWWLQTTTRNIHLWKPKYPIRTPTMYSCARTAKWVVFKNMHQFCHYINHFPRVWVKVLIFLIEHVRYQQIYYWLNNNFSCQSRRILKSQSNILSIMSITSQHEVFKWFLFPTPSTKNCSRPDCEADYEAGGFITRCINPSEQHEGLYLQTKNYSSSSLWLWLLILLNLLNDNI